MDFLLVAIGFAIGCAGGAMAAHMVRRRGEEKNRDAIKAEAEAIKARIIEEGRAEVAKAKAAATEECLKARQELEKEIRNSREEIRRAEKKIERREDLVEQRLRQVEQKEAELTKLEQRRMEILKEAEARRAEVEKLAAEEREKLSRISGLSTEQAKQMLLERIEAESAREIAELSARAIKRARENADAEARKVILDVIQRIATDAVAEATVSTIDLPSDEMKGRIIGREGRNIRAFEKATGVDVIVDDTPGVVVVSGFDPVRREVARAAMQKLVSDGRIHPARIEEMVAKSESEINEIIEQTGRKVCADLGIRNIHPKLVTMIGRLRYRSSYGQNILQHVVECAHIAAALAAEMKLDVNLARRCALLHDIGKAADQETEGTHPQIGMEIARQCEERQEVIESIGGHHGDMEIHSLYPIICQIADSLSASRPGARRESLEKYIKRMERLEEIASSNEGIEKAFAIQAGREVRVMARADKLSDKDCARIARDIAKKIEEELEYPGEVKVTLIRESRFIEYAR
ncbi:MAG: ribonuclease Y [Planctomycetota bacterium]|nr:ribonuclease Y [Planctomycetota bacterium]